MKFRVEPRYTDCQIYVVQARRWLFWTNLSRWSTEQMAEEEMKTEQEAWDWRNALLTVFTGREYGA